MKKAEYIEKYGEEKYQEHLASSRKRYLEHKEEYFARRNKWSENNKEQMKIITKRANEKWRKNNPDYQKNWYIKNKENRIEIARRRANSNNAADKQRGLDISKNVSSKWIVENIFSGQACIYCGDQDWTHLGCDRIDNSKPHTADNVVCSCGLCNIEKNDRYTVEEFKQYRILHPRACDIPKAPAIQLSGTGALKKRAVQIG